MFKKYLILTLLILGFTFQISFAESIKFKSTQKGIDGNPLLLTGVLTKPEGHGPFPAIVLLHGWCGPEFGKPRSTAWSSRLVDWGYVTLQLDSFGSRNVSNDCSDKTELFLLSLASVKDAYDAKDYLAEIPYIDRNRIALLGWWLGGHTSLYVLSKQIKPQSKETPFKAGIAFYPYCDMPLYNLNAPLLILIGEFDDLTLAKWCSEMMPPEQSDLEIILKIYSGAYHDFDWEGTDELYEGHRLLYDPIAAQNAIIQVKSFLAKHLKGILHKNSD
jgi:dienelactone hydrolase